MRPIVFRQLLALKTHLFNTSQRKKPRVEALLLKECKRGFIAHSKQFTYKVKLVRSPYLGLFIFSFYSNKVKDKQEKQVNHTYFLIEAKIFMEAKK